MARNTFQDIAYSALIGQLAGKLQQVRANIQSGVDMVTAASAGLARLQGSLTTPDPQFGAADQADIDQLVSLLSFYNSVVPAGETYGQAMADFLASSIGS